MTRTTALAATLTLAFGLIVRADVWDIQTQNDNLHTTTRNELVHGSEQVHDVAALPGPVADVDWFRISQAPHSSYEIVIDAISGDAYGKMFQVQRMASDGVTVLQIAAGIGVGYGRSLRFANDTSSVINNEYIVVRGATCATSCGADDTYRIRMTETTYAAPRFNNGAGQTSSLILQNSGNTPTQGNVNFWSTAGALLATMPFSLGPKQLLTLPTSTVVPGANGSITIEHDGPYGEMTGKLTTIEPATGMAFDTQVSARPR